MLFSVFIIILLLSANFIVSNDYISRKELISRRIETNINSCNIIKEIDTHGGFLGDGNYFAKIKCFNDIDTINWKRLPLSKNINDSMKIEWCNSDGCLNAFSRFNIPNLKEGYYFFNDRNSEAVLKYDDTNLNKRSSYNYSVAIYDDVNNIIYYYELDT